MSAKPNEKAGALALSRRAFLSVSMAAPFLMATQEVFAQSPDANKSPLDTAGFQALAIAIIGSRADDRTLSDAYYSAFQQTNPAFLVRAAILSDAIKAANIVSPAAFSSSPLAADAVMKATAIALTAAWYLGHVAKDEQDDQSGGKVVAYEKALMWAPTSDITVIPSYSRGAPNYWAEQTQQIESAPKSL